VRRLPRRRSKGLLLDEKFYRDLIDNLHDGIYFVDRDRIITYWNKGAERITGYPVEKAVGISCRENLLNHVTSNGVELCGEHCPLAAVMKDGSPREAEVYLHHADGHRVPVFVRATPLRNAEGTIVGAIETFSSNSNADSARRQLHEMRLVAFTDGLTGIGNRKHLEGRLSAAIAEFERNQARFALLFLDVDRFKGVNDTYGHEVGDKILQMVARTLRHALRATDTTGRWGGEEFLAILNDVPDRGTLLRIADKLRVLIENSSLSVDGASLGVTVSIGGTWVAEGDTAETWVHRADKLMYQSKNNGRNKTTVE
jgi:diguanylate cyclase (GGDEF)-like protein/PAS domain S-box-containing protein